MKSTGLREAEIRRFAALLRGGEPWDRVRTAIPGLSPEVIERFRPTIEALAAEPGPAAKIPTPISEEEDRERLDRWVEAQRAGRKARWPVKRSVGGRR